MIKNAKADADCCKKLKKQLKDLKSLYARTLETSAKERESAKIFAHLLFDRFEEDRKEISRELHDEIGQVLTGINYELEVLSKEASNSAEGVRNKIQVTQKLVEKSVEIVHRFAKELRPMILDDLGLIPALRSYIKEFSSRTQILVKFEPKSSFKSLDDFSKTVLFRVAQEALSNIRKHSQATEATLKIGHDKENILMSIKDNGRGKALGKRIKGRLGIIGMQERAKMAGGHLTITSSPKKGTLVSLSIPKKSRRRHG